MDWREVPSNARAGDVFPDPVTGDQIKLTSETHYTIKRKR